jgi:small multidrug resistance family-3 protein
LAGSSGAPRPALGRRRNPALGVYGFVATLQPDPHFGRILAAYGGVFVAGSLLWGVVLDGFRPDRYDIVGAVICLLGVAVILYAPRAA